MISEEDWEKIEGAINVARARWVEMQFKECAQWEMRPFECVDREIERLQEESKAPPPEGVK